MFSILAALFLWPAVIYPHEFLSTPLPQATDFLVTHLPYAQYVHYSWINFHQIPLWNSLLFSGQPFAADPLSGYGYLPNWLGFFFPVPATFNLLFWLHLTWAGCGVYYFLKTEDLVSGAAFPAAVAFMGTPKLIAYIGVGQVSLVYAVCWTPWLLLAVRWMLPSGGWWRGLPGAACLAVITLADVRWGFFAGLLAVAYGLTRVEWRKAGLWRAFQALATLVIFEVILTASLSLPLIEFMQVSRRNNLSLEQLSLFSITPSSWIGLLAPQIGVIYELVIYMGLAPLLLALVGLSRRRWFWGIVLLAAVLYSAGQSGFIFPLLTSILPGLSWLRVPSRAWFIVALAVSLLAGYGFDHLLKIPPTQVYPKVLRYLPIAGSLFFILIASGLTILSHQFFTGIWTLAVLFPMAMLLHRLFATGTLDTQVAPLVLTAFILADLLWVNSFELAHYPLPAATPAVEWLSQKQAVELSRVYSPDYSLPMPNLLQQVNGVDPLHLDSYANFIRRASKINGGEYSVSLPDIYLDANTSPQVRQAAALPDANMFGLLNTRYLAAQIAIKAPGWKWVQDFGDVHVYENTKFRGRAWLDGGDVAIDLWSPDRIVLQTNGAAGELTLSEIAYPGWQVSVDGNARPVKIVESLLRAVDVPAGAHQVEFVFRPWRVYLGWGLSFLGWIGILGSFIFVWRRWQVQGV